MEIPVHSESTGRDLPSAAGSPENRAASGASESVRLRSGFAWLDSAWFGLTMSLIVGLLYTLVLLGPGPLDPHNTGWLIADSADHYIGWELFRQDPHWHWPLTYTDRVSYPVGEAVALMDPNPLLIVLLKPFSALLPEPFQYFGMEAVLAAALQFFLATRLFLLLLGRNRIGAWLCSLFFLVAPPLALRLGGDFSLSNQWLLVAALLVFFQAQQESLSAVRRFIISGFLLATLAVAINPYLAFQVLLVLAATAGSLLWQRRLTPAKAVGFVAALGVACSIVAYSLGLLSTHGQRYHAGGYRWYAMNLLTPFDPHVFGSILPRLLPPFPSGPVHTGNYLGAGVIFLAVLLLVLFAMQPGKLRSLDRRQVVPLLLCCLALTLMAFSTKIWAGSTSVDLDPQQHLTRFLAPLRASERLFWVPYYTILMAALAAPFLLLRRSQATLLLAVVLVIQLADLAPLRRLVHRRVNQDWPLPFKSPVWSQLGSVHENLVVLPAFQCGIPATPGEADGFRIFGLLATTQKMRTNGYPAARFTKASFDFHCNQSIAALAQQPLSPDTAYVVTPALAAVIAAGPTGPGKCHDVDDFILCSSKLDFGPAPPSTR